MVVPTVSTHLGPPDFSAAVDLAVCRRILKLRLSIKPSEPVC